MKKIIVPLVSVVVLWETLRLLRKSKGNPKRLSRREREVLNLIAEGYTDNEIAIRLHKRGKAIKKYERKILKRLHVHDASSAVRYGIEKGLVNITYA